VEPRFGVGYLTPAAARLAPHGDFAQVRALRRTGCEARCAKTRYEKFGGYEVVRHVLACRGVWVTPGEACDAVYVRTAARIPRQAKTCLVVGSVKRDILKSTKGLED